MKRFPEVLQKSLKEMKITSFTTIQEKSFPTILAGENAVILAETGSGKTLAYILPILTKLLESPKRPTKALIIAPTKELAEQILKVAKDCAQSTNIISAAIYGGKSFSQQTREIKNGLHLIVACPGRLVEHIEQKTIDLSGVEYLVLDEADQLFDMGFRPQLEIALEATLNRRQTLLLSATMNEEIKTLSDQYFPNFKIISHQENKKKAIIEEIFCPIDRELKYPFLRFLLKEYKIKSCIIFCNTKDEARNLYTYMSSDKYKVALLEGDMSTHQRKKSLLSLKEKAVQYLVATDVASRGLDIPHLEFIINLSPPLNIDSYIHRLGRSARHESSGTALTLYTKDDEELDLEKILSNEDKALKPKKFKAFNYGLKINKKNGRLL